MKAYQDMNQDELKTLHQQLSKQYQDMKDLHLQLNMARGKPDFSQVQLSMPLLDVINSTRYKKKEIERTNSIIALYINN